MNSTHLFNLDYFIQNLKKSRALIIIIAILLPLYTVHGLTIFSALDNVMNFWEIGLFNTVFMYMIPVVLSLTLFNYVFKKQSCDFIGSMPLSRKTIFVTNTLGGIVILFGIQAISALITLLITSLNPHVYLFGTMLWESFIYFTISYIFVFIASNLAVSFSGNRFSAIVSLLLIIFLVPFTLTWSTFDVDTDSYLYRETASEYFEETIEVKENLNFTAPSFIFELALTEGEYKYNSAIVIKMCVLSVIYFFIGLWLFQRKQYEMAGESYENDIVHLIIKMLTLSPFVAILSQSINEEVDIVTFFFLIFIGIYYFIFDLITNKKMSYKITLPSFFASLIIMLAFYSLVVPRLEGLLVKKVNVDDIKTATIETIDYGMDNNFFGLTIDDEDGINKLLTSEQEYYNSSRECLITITLNNGKTYQVDRNLGDTLKQVINKYGDTKYVMQNINTIPMIEDMKLTNEDKDNLLKAIEQDTADITYKEMYRIINQDRCPYYLKTVAYKNHQLITRDYSYKGYQNTFDVLTTYFNKKALKSARYSVAWDITNQEAFQEYVQKANPNVMFDIEEFDPEEYLSGDDYTDDYYYYIADDGRRYKEYDYEKTIRGVCEEAVNALSPLTIQEFITSHEEDAFDKIKPYIELYGRQPLTVYFTNDIEGFYKICAKAYNEEYSQYTGIKLNENV